jgi:hypothetical protein
MRNAHATSGPPEGAGPGPSATVSGSLSETRALGLQPRRITDRVLSRALGAGLDGQLAAGRSPESARLLAVRAADIVRLPRREALARYWERVLRVARDPYRASAAAISLRRERVLATEPAILELARLLRVPLPVTARGVAMARVLLTDGGGPLYAIGAPASLDESLRAAIAWLDPALPLIDDLGRGPVERVGPGGGGGPGKVGGPGAVPAR